MRPQAVVYCVALALYRVFFHPLRKYPGPVWNRITEYPFVLAGLRGELPYYTDALFKKYGPVVRLGPNNLGFIRSSAWRDIYDARHKAQVEKAYEYYRETEQGPISMVNAGHEEHDRLRKWVAPRFSERGIRDQEAMIRGYVDLLVRRLHEHCGGGQTTLDLRDWCTFCGLGTFHAGLSFWGGSMRRHRLTLCLLHQTISALLTSLANLPSRATLAASSRPNTTLGSDSSCSSREKSSG